MSSTSEYTDDEEAPPPTSFEIEPQFRLIDFSPFSSQVLLSCSYDRSPIGNVRTSAVEINY